MAESQKHGFLFENIIINNIFTNPKNIEIINEFKINKYTSRWDVPTFEELVHNLGDVGMSEQEFNSGIIDGLTLPISIKSQPVNKKEIEFGDIMRTIENFSLEITDEFNVILLEYSQNGDNKDIVNIDCIAVNKDSVFCQELITNKHRLLNEVSALTRKVSKLPKNTRIDKVILKEMRGSFKSVLNDTELSARIKVDSKTQRRTQCVFPTQKVKEAGSKKILSSVHGTSIYSPVRVRNKSGKLPLSPQP